MNENYSPRSGAANGFAVPGPFSACYVGPERGAALGEGVTTADRVDCGVVVNPRIDEAVPEMRFRYDFECYDADGNLKWADGFDNLVTTQGKNDVLDKYFKGSAYTAAWYLGLKGTGTAVVGDTAASHAGWAEVNPYTGNRPAIAFGTTSAGSNTATTNTYTCTSGATVAGAFVQSANTGTTGVLYSAGDFASPRTVASGDVVNATLTVTAS